MLNTGVLALNRDLADYNGSLAATYARADNDKVQRDMHRGEVLAGPLKALSEEQSELNDNMQSFTLPFEVVGTSILTGVTSIANGVLSVVKSIPSISRILQGIEDAAKEEDSGDPIAWKAFFEDITDGKIDPPKPTFDSDKGAVGGSISPTASSVQAASNMLRNIQLMRILMP